MRKFGLRGPYVFLRSSRAWAQSSTVVLIPCHHVATMPSRSIGSPRKALLIFAQIDSNCVYECRYIRFVLTVKPICAGTKLPRGIILSAAVAPSCTLIIACILACTPASSACSCSSDIWIGAAIFLCASVRLACAHVVTPAASLSPTLGALVFGVPKRSESVLEIPQYK